MLKFVLSKSHIIILIVFILPSFTTVIKTTNMLWKHHFWNSFGVVNVQFVASSLRISLKKLHNFFHKREFFWTQNYFVIQQHQTYPPNLNFKLESKASLWSHTLSFSLQCFRSFVFLRKHLNGTLFLRWWCVYVSEYKFFVLAHRRMQP